jgi:glycosyltransferase involved in cell wall biosynthesis
MKILSLISSKTDPAARFRIMQYKEPLKILGSHVKYIVPSPPKDSDPPRRVFKSKKIWHACQVAGRLKMLPLQYFYDIIWQNRLLLYDHYSLEKYIKKPFVFDMDDAIWLTEGEKQVQLAIKKSTLVFAGNEYLADYCRRINSNTTVIPSAIDTNVFKPLAPQNKSFVIGWIGSKSNFSYLELIKTPVLQFLEQTKNTKLFIVSSDPPDTFQYDDDRIVFKKWSPEKENEMINEFSIGLMPLPDNSWTKGKCGFKMLQYMACGKPAIVSPVGINNNILKQSKAGIAAINEHDWFKAMHDLKNDPALYADYAAKGRPYVEDNFSCSKWAVTINNHFKELCPGNK